MEKYPKLVLSYPNLENLLEPLAHAWVMTLEILFLPLFKYNLMQLRFLLRNLTRFHYEHLVLILKHKNTSWLVMSSVRKYQAPLCYVLKFS
jgi:hypothetical protein